MPASLDSETFHDIRKTKKPAQAALSEKADTTIRYLRDTENGKKRNPSVATVYKSGAALSVSMETPMIIQAAQE